MTFSERPLAIFDLETSGLDFFSDEVIEIGMVKVNQQTLEVEEEFETKVRPLGEVSEGAKTRNGYSPEAWEGSPRLVDAMLQLSQLTLDCVPASWNVTFDWGFLAKAQEVADVDLKLDYHRLDIMSIALGFRWFQKPESLSLKNFCLSIGLEPEPEPHGALAGARRALEVLRRTLDLTWWARPWDALGEFPVVGKD